MSGVQQTPTQQRSSLSCCQGEDDRGSANDVSIVPASPLHNYEMKEKHTFPKRPEVNLVFKNIRYHIKQWNFRNIKPEMKEILHGVSGQFRAGELTAIMGPSGAGKSTLLNVLAGFTVQGVSGEVYVNGKQRMPYSERWKRTSSYIQQDSLPRTKLTVGEAMTLAANLKLGYSVSSTLKHTQVLNLLEMLGLNDCYNTLCGRLSGGQKKRLDVAFELLSNPSVLFLDEPTTGLDSASCSSCIALLQRLAKVERRTVVCTIHQPSALLFEMFDTLYAVAGGRCIYRGSITSLLPHLTSIGVNCPPYHNPADFLIEVAIGDYDVGIDKLSNATEKTWEDQELPIIQKRTFENMMNEPPPPPAGFLAQCYLLYKRKLMCLRRDNTLLTVRLLCHLIIGIIFGYLYMGSGLRANGVLANYVYLYGSLLLIVYTGKMAVTLAFPLEMQILKREHFNRWYKLAPYYISLLLVEVPFQAACASTYLVVSYWLTTQPMEAQRIVHFMVVSIAASLTAQAWGFFIGATTPVKIAVFAGPVIAVLFSVFGFCIRYMDTPAGFRWIFHISYFRAGFHSLLFTVYGFGRDKLSCDDNDQYCHYAQPVKFLKEMEIDQTNVVNNLVLIIGIGVLMHLLTASALWCKLNRR